MTNVPEDLLHIVIQARFLSEYLSDPHLPTAVSATDRQRADERVAHWCQVVAEGNQVKFQNRLRWDDLCVDQVRTALGATLWPNGKELPIWTETLNEIIQSTKNYVVENKISTGSDVEAQMPFEHILLPVIYVARRQLLASLGYDSLSPTTLPLQLFTEQAYIALERSLLIRLANLSVRTLDFEFSNYRPQGQTLLTLLVGELPGEPSKIYYNAFVQRLLSDGLFTFFQKYPVLGRLFSITVNFWVEATTEFIKRLLSDLSDIQCVFACSANRMEGGQELGKITKINTSLSDPHHQGRSVIALVFESGLKLVYKPKNLDIEIAFTQLLEWCNRHDELLSLKVLKVLSRQAYGWVEYVEHSPCRTKTAVQNFYYRAGMLLSLLYILRGTDCHHENLVANDEDLVLVDMETLLHHDMNPVVNHAETTQIGRTADEQFWDSVLRTGLLPRWDFGKDNRIAYDVSGLGSISAQEVPWKVAEWKSINTDNMHVLYENATMPINANAPILDGGVQSPNEYLAELTDGFQGMYRFLLRNRHHLLGPDSPLTVFQGQRVRFVFRPTRVYAAVLQHLLDPTFLQSGVDWGIELDILSRAFLASQTKPVIWSILHAEIAAVEQLDIPYFGATTNSDVLVVESTDVIKNCFKGSSYAQCMDRLKKLSEKDLTHQVDIIRDSFYARVARISRSTQGLTVTDLAEDKNPEIQSPILTRAELFQEARQIAASIRDRAIEGADSSINWIGMGYIPDANRFQLQPLAENLYDGRCGVALFLAALDYVTGEYHYQDIILRALQSLRSVLQSSDTELSRKFARRLGVGGAIGLGSVVYCLTKIGQFLKDTALLENALMAVDLMIPEDVSTERQFDVVEGAAGAILGLLPLHRITHESSVLSKATTFGDYLATHYLSVNGYPKGWKSIAANPQTGFSHGAAGIAYALLQLYSVTGTQTYLDVAQAAIAYESSTFVHSINNWPHFSSANENEDLPEYRVSWCGGAPGIGMARLGGLSMYRTAEIEQQIDAAIQTTQNFGWQGVDHLCCGNFGRIDVLVLAGQKLSRPDLHEFAHRKATWAVKRAKQNGGYQLFADLPHSVFNPVFFQGMAGIGYELLRLAMPTALPSALLWE